MFFCKVGGLVGVVLGLGLGLLVGAIFWLGKIRGRGASGHLLLRLHKQGKPNFNKNPPEFSILLSMSSLVWQILVQMLLRDHFFLAVKP